ncbi:2-amino-4-hydroxy-6-hydroxymethyldihydropteridine diphosphokinase [Oricola sp.]|uniref:2-amino-4-hydroxy-6- hydroxymethyldihydropteridine diphosphokinase n=1 Tax=Oricola sp. TaxID=1979950 RepID=UPI003BA9C2ED
MSECVIAVLGLGGNVGEVPETMRGALLRLDAQPQCHVIGASSVYRTPPWGPVEQDWFHNACATIRTRLSPEALLACVLETERAFGRVRDQRWGPRTLDIDILMYGDMEVSNDDLTIPHPRMTDRAFVMVPLAEIAADLELGGRYVRDIAAGFADEPLERTDYRIWGKGA